MSRTWLSIRLQDTGHRIWWVLGVVCPILLFAMCAAAAAAAGGHFVVFVFAASNGASIKTKNKQRQHQRFILKTTTAMVH